MKKLWNTLFFLVLSLTVLLSLCGTALAVDESSSPDTLADVDLTAVAALTGDAVITADQTQPIAAAAAGVTIRIENAVVDVLLVDPSAEGTRIILTGGARVTALIIMAKGTVIITEAGTTLGSASVIASGVTLSVAGTADNIFLAGTAKGATLAVAETARVKTLSIAAPGVIAGIRGEAGAVEASGSSGLVIDAAAGATVGSVTAPADTEVRGEGADKVKVTTSEMPAGNTEDSKKPARKEKPGTSVSSGSGVSAPSRPSAPVCGGNTGNAPDTAASAGPENPKPPVEDEEPVENPSAKIEEAYITSEELIETPVFHYLTLKYTFDEENGRVTGYTIEWERTVQVINEDGTKDQTKQTWQAAIEIRSAEQANSNRTGTMEDGQICYIHTTALEGILFQNTDNPEETASKFEDYSGSYRVTMSYQKEGAEENAVPEKSESYSIGEYNDPLKKTEEPEESGKPGEAENPGENKDSDDTGNPGENKDPDETGNPGENKEPDETENPG
ncbi:MAG: hypothetical protein K2N78_02860, partial [Oscillospiraceae bacterium]|nr:hypothetical protein [Oscillospiraceae bacterium]